MTNTLSTLPVPNHFGSIGWVLVILVAIVAGVNQVLKLLDRAKPTPPANEVYQTITMCRQLHSTQEDRIQRNECAVDEIRREIKDMGLRLDKNDEERAKAIHDRVNHIEGQLGRVLGILEKKGHI